MVVMTQTMDSKVLKNVNIYIILKYINVVPLYVFTSCTIYKNGKHVVHSSSTISLTTSSSVSLVVEAAGV